MSRRSMYPAHRIATPSQIGAQRMAKLAEVCEFDMSSPGQDWAMWTVLKHDTHLRRYGLDGRQADLGLHYSIRDNARLAGTYRMMCHAYGHAANPRATHFKYETMAGRDIGEFVAEEGEWLDEVAMHHVAVQKVIDRGGDPLRPGSANVVTDPCLTRLIAHHGMEANEFLDLLPRFGRFVIGRNWYRTNPMPRVVEMAGMRAHLERTATRLKVLRIGLGPGVSYTPPEPGKAKPSGILHTQRIVLAETLRDALVGQPLSRMVDHPALDAGLVIRTISNAGNGVAVRVDGCDEVRPMDEVETNGKAGA